MTDDFEGTPPADLLQQLLAELRRSQMRLDAESDRVSNLQMMIRHLLSIIAGGADSAMSQPAPPSAAALEALKVAARAGVAAVQITFDPQTGSAWVSIDGGQPFRVQRKPALLLRIIAAPGGRPAGDGFVGWRSYTDIAALLAKETGCRTTRRTVVVALAKLRAAFKRARANWLLIDSDRRGAVRFRLRTSALLATAEDAETPPAAGAVAGDCRR